MSWWRNWQSICRRKCKIRLDERSNILGDIKVYFSDFFGVEEEVVDEYGAVNISLINDLPLFIDPFLLFNSENPDFQDIHREMIDYLLFLQEQSERMPKLNSGMKKAWFSFSEVKQTWLGFSLSGNAGCGMGNDFANSLFECLNSIFKDFGKEKITKGHHMEKLCLISPRVGRDKISDFTTNFAKKYLLEYTQEFARTYLEPEYCKEFTVGKVCFNWETTSWMAKKYYLPCYEGDYVLLTPKAMLTRDDTFINRIDMIRNLQEITPSISDDALRFELEMYFRDVLSKKKKEMSQKEKDDIATEIIKQYPELIDYYVKYKEDNQADAISISKEKVREVELLFNDQISQLIALLNEKTQFYHSIPDAHKEAKQRVEFLKHVIEDQEGYRLFYANGKPIKREADLQVIYRLVWYGSSLDVNREVNNGRGPVDYKISYGKKNSTLVEFKLASNSKLKQNLAKQVEIYKAASETERAIKVIMYFTEKEYEKLCTVLNELGLADCKDIVLIDARDDNKESASNVTIAK